jgi:hypothetical protein
LFGSLSFNDPFTLLLLSSATILLLGYLAGRAVNKRRARLISAWLEPGFRSLGGTPAVQAVKPSVFRVKVVGARTPLDVVTATVVLISREWLPTWLWELLRGNQDVLVVHLTLKQPPSMEAEIINPNNDLGRRGEEQVRALGWASVDADPGCRLYYSADTPLRNVHTLAGEVASKPFTPWRVAVRRNAPHMLLSMPMPDISRVQSAELVRWLTKLSRSLRSSGGDSIR